ncbi:MAG: amidohydrolase [Hespellia sp.]|nr:amidohydrolase [Hespellia sp.]
MSETIQTIFRYLHRNPELPAMEENTTNYICEILSRIDGIEIERFDTCYGLLAKLQGRQPGKKIVFRADIDALPIIEATNLEYKSQNNGVMHACGHDIHISVAIELARKLAEDRERFNGEVYFLFQPEEENALGAKKVLASKKLAGMDLTLSLHTNPGMNCGEIGIKSGPITANVDRFRIVVDGTGCHGAQPQNGRDPIVAASAIVMALQSIVSRNVNPAERAVVSVTHFDGGKDWNIIPAQVILEGTVRTFDAQTRTMVKEQIEHISTSVAEAYGTRAAMEMTDGPIATNNDEKITVIAKDYGLKHGYAVVEGEQSMVGEDYAFIQREIPGLMVWLGVGKGPGLHNPEYVADARAIETGASYFAGLIQQLLNER